MLCPLLSILPQGVNVKHNESCTFMDFEVLKHNDVVNPVMVTPEGVVTKYILYVLLAITIVLKIMFVAWGISVNFVLSAQKKYAANGFERKISGWGRGWVRICKIRTTERNRSPLWTADKKRVLRQNND